MNKNVRDAQLHNARRMTNSQLQKELGRVLGFPEKPPIRVAWISILRAEQLRRYACPLTPLERVTETALQRTAADLAYQKAVQRAHDKGASLRQIAAAAGVTHQSIHARLKTT